MKTLVLACCLFAGISHCLAQRVNREEYNLEESRRENRRMEQELKKIVVRYEKNNRGEYEFYCENKTWSTYTVEINFPELVDLQADVALPARLEAEPGTHRLFASFTTCNRILSSIKTQTVAAGRSRKGGVMFRFISGPGIMGKPG
jgi:hypothetical protein